MKWIFALVRSSNMPLSYYQLRVCGWNTLRTLLTRFCRWTLTYDYGFGIPVLSILCLVKTMSLRRPTLPSLPLASNALIRSQHRRILLGWHCVTLSNTNGESIGPLTVALYSAEAARENVECDRGDESRIKWRRILSALSRILSESGLVDELSEKGECRGGTCKARLGCK